MPCNQFPNEAKLAESIYSFNKYIKDVIGSCRAM